MREEFENWENTQVFDWISQKDIPYILDGTDFAVTRASATTLAELTTRPIRLIIVPLAISAGDHQFHNARVYEKYGHTVILEKDLERNGIFSGIFDLPPSRNNSEGKTSIAPLLKIFEN